MPNPSDNAAPPDPKPGGETPDTTPANAGIRFEDPRTKTGGGSEGDGVPSDR